MELVGETLQASKETGKLVGEDEPHEWSDWRVRRYDRRAERLARLDERRDARRRRRDERWVS